MIFLAPLILIHVAYFISLYKKNMGLIDGFWGLGFVTMSVSAVILSGGVDIKQNLLGFLLLLWGGRLAIFLFVRNWSKPEDFRYAQWRQDWKEKTELISYFKVFLLQYFLMLMIGTPIWCSYYSPSEISILTFIGIGIFCCGLIYETISDQQKSRFKSAPGNEYKLCKIGLWRYSRHPNYLGEITLWYGLGIMALNMNGGRMSDQMLWNFLCMLGPMIIHFLILKVSGVPLIEAKHKSNSEYLTYMHTTPRMIPSFIFKSRR
ncbi:MAG: DUF1295 domain-containing protein [Bacteriovoracaceae bacterium]|nr:DUF1295 domain-containing protein [Bacteriovoracaceae bacterium]